MRAGIEIEHPSQIHRNNPADKGREQNGAQIEQGQLLQDAAGYLFPAQPDLVQHLIAEPVPGGIRELLHGEHGQRHADEDQPRIDQRENDGGQQELCFRNQIVPDHIFVYIHRDWIRAGGHGVQHPVAAEILIAVP